MLNISYINSVLNRLLQLDGCSGILWTANFYKKKHFMFHILPCSQTLAYSTFWMATFKILAKTVFVYESGSVAEWLERQIWNP